MKKKVGIISIIFLLFSGIFLLTHLLHQSRVSFWNTKEKPVIFGATYMTMNNPFFEVIDDEIRNVIEANGDIMISMDPQLSLERQIEQINYMIDEGCQVIIVNPVDSKGLEEVLKKAKEKGIYVIAVDTNVYNGNDFVDYTVVSDNEKAGRLIALDMMSRLPQANIILLEHERPFRQ